MINFITELSQYGFIVSIVYTSYILLNFLIKFYGKNSLGINTKFKLTIYEKIMLLLSFSYIITYLF